MKKKIAAIFAHPDDEVLACGGMLAKHAQQGDDVAIFMMATGLTSRGDTSDKELEILRSQANNAANILGVQDISFEGFPDNAMDSVPLLDVTKSVENFLESFPADIIYTHHMGDMNIDHMVVARAVLTATRPVPGTKGIVVLAGEINSSTEYAVQPMPPFVPTEFYDISDTLDLKIKSMAAYEGELREWPHPRSLKGIEYQAKNRGAQCGVDAAEVFATLRRIIK